LNQFDRDAASDYRCGSLQAGKRDVVFWVKQAVNLGATGLER